LKGAFRRLGLQLVESLNRERPNADHIHPFSQVLQSRKSVTNLGRSWQAAALVNGATEIWPYDAHRSSAARFVRSSEAAAHRSEGLNIDEVIADDGPKEAKLTQARSLFP